MKTVMLTSAIVLLIGSLLMWSFYPQTSAAREVSIEGMVSTIRTLNTAQAMYFQANNRFAEKAELLEFLREKNYLKSLHVDLEGADAIDLGVTTSSDGAHYQLGMKQPVEKGRPVGCKTAGFSDDGGVIYLGTPLDCQNQSSAK